MTAWMGSSVGFRVVNTKVSDVKTNVQNVSPGVLGSVQNVCGKIANCSAAEGNASIRISLGSLSRNSPCLAERSELYFLVRVQIPQWKRKRDVCIWAEEVWSRFWHTPGWRGLLWLGHCDMQVFFQLTGICIDNLIANLSNITKAEWARWWQMPDVTFSIRYCNVFLLSQIPTLQSLYIAREHLMIFEVFVLTLIFWGTWCCCTAGLGSVYSCLECWCPAWAGCSGEVFVVRNYLPEKKIPPVLRQMGQWPLGSISLSILTIEGVSAIRLVRCLTPTIAGPLENCSRHEGIFRNLVLCYFPDAINET